MDTEQWPQEIGHVKPMEEMISSCSRPILERRMRPQKEQALTCPRCNSTNTKFCYYNNYSLSQPRYFCKTCRRYWTEGGSLRNVPVGGGSRKNKRSSSSSSSSSSKKNNTDLIDPTSTKIQEGQDLNLAFPNSQEYHHGISADHATLAIENNNNSNNPPCSSSTTSALELLRSGFGSRSLNPYMATVPDPNTYPSLAFGLHDFNRSNFNVPGFSGYGNFQESGKVLFPFEDLRQVSSNTGLEESKVQGDSTGYWSGMLGGGSWSQVPNYGP